MAKGQGLPITTIIIAALGILVLIIIAAIFGGQITTIGRITAVCPVTHECRSATGIEAAREQFRGLGEPGGVSCSEGYTPLSEIRLKAGQDKNVKPEDAAYCAPCCVPVGA